MTYLLDTHILLWWFINSPSCPKRFFKLIRKEEASKRSVGISIITLWEIAKLVALGKIELALSLDQWFEELENDAFIKVLPLERMIILESNRLGPDFHKDPADQLIVATARVHGLKLITVDQKIIQSNMVAIARTR